VPDNVIYGDFRHIQPVIMLYCKVIIFPGFTKTTVFTPEKRVSRRFKDMLKPKGAGDEAR